MTAGPAVPQITNMARKSLQRLMRECERKSTRKDDGGFNDCMNVVGSMMAEMIFFAQSVDESFADNITEGFRFHLENAASQGRRKQ